MPALPRPRIHLRLPMWRLRTGLVLPIILIVPLFLALTAVLWEDVAQREAESLVAQRQEAALAGLSAQLTERRSANAMLAYLLAKRDGMGDFVETRNTLRLQQTLIVMQAALNVDYINVYAANGEQIVHVGTVQSGSVD